jgi:NADPH:quinone reductase-like Zn-dependent oxidoreductase
LISTAVHENNRGNQFQKIMLIVTDPSEDNGLLASLKEGLLEGVGVADVSIVSILDLANKYATDAVCIPLLELKHPVLSQATEIQYLGIRKILTTCGGLLWVTGDPNLRPELNMITGLLRTVRWERDLDSPNLLTLSIADAGLPDDSLAKLIVKIYKHQFVEAISEFRNSEYLYQGGVIHTNRLFEPDVGNDFLASRFSKLTPQLTPFGETSRPVQLTTAEPGLLNKLEWVTDVNYYEPLGDTQVEIDIRAVGLNFRDLMIAMGEHTACSFGCEAAGIVTRIGSGVKKIKPGDRVVYLCGLGGTGCFHTFGRLDQDAVVKIPDDLSYQIAASLPCVYATAIYGLGNAARLSRGETILIHAAAGGVGQAAIHYAKMVGAEIYATVSTPKKRDLLVTEYAIPEDHIFSSRDQTFARGIMRCTKGRGVDVILNSLSGELLHNSWECIAPFGRFVEIGKKDARAYGKAELTPFLRNVTMTSVDLPTMMQYRPNLIIKLVEDTIRLYGEGKIGEAKPTNVMGFSQVEEGLRLLQSGEGMGKMVFVPSRDDLIPVVPDPLPPYNFQGNASYVLAGGLGGLGRSIARWMALRGARNLIFLSRSGKITDSVQEMVDDLQNNGCNVRIFTCDVSDKYRLCSVIGECSVSLPPIKGCIQGAMTLKVIIPRNLIRFLYCPNPCLQCCD